MDDNFLYSFARFNLYYHFVAFLFIPLFVLGPFIYYFLPLMLLMFIGPALPLTAYLVMSVYAMLERSNSIIVDILTILSWFVSLAIVIASYFLYKKALKHKESCKWLIILPIIWAYPIPIMAYTIAVYYEYFLKTLHGEQAFRSYHFPGVGEMLMSLIFIGFFIATIYTIINICIHIKLYKHYKTGIIE